MARLEYNIHYLNLKNPVTAYLETYADSTMSERWANTNCDEVAKLLNEAKIKFAAHDGGFFVEIITEREDYETCKVIAENSQFTPSWTWWLKQYPSPNACIIKGGLL